jgi:tetratricopeptide (TPR) repeat protein
MSLLLEALKKAEKAKEEAQRRAKGADVPTGSPFDSEATVLDDGKHVTTRAELPDISAPLEILSEDLRSGTQSRAAPLQLALTDEPPPAPEAKAPPRRENPRAQAETPNAERVTAQRVFEAKFKEPNPRLPFYITVGVLGAFAIGTVIYFWLQLRPAPSLVNTNPVRAADEKQVDPTAAPAPPPLASSAQSAPGQGSGAIPGLPSAQTSAAAAAPVPAVLAAPAPTTTAPVAALPAAPVAAPAAPAVMVARAPRSKPAAAAKSDDRPLTINRGGPQIHPQVTAGYAAYQAGDLTKARSEYLLALRDEPANRDALLGLAAVEMRSQRYDLADGYYQRVLQADPREPHAQAGMLALRSQQLDPIQVESRVKSLIANDRESNVLYFTLGNQYAQQGRWAEAQQAYFKAFATDPDNPDFAFNLAVSVDQLRQPKLALEYYRRALALAEKHNANFDLDSARTRVQQLSR